MIQNKKRKTDSGKLQCEFFLARKNRQCSMQRKKDEKFCSEHLMHDKESYSERVPCPLDPKHSVWAKDLQKHLKKCNGKPKEKEVWYSERINSVLRKEKSEKAEISTPEPETESTEKASENSVAESEEDLLKRCIGLLESFFKDLAPLEKHIKSHPGLNPRLAELTNKKHALQQSSLVGNLKENGLLGTDRFYIEFGCGKGELSRTLNQCIVSEKKTLSQDLETDLKKDLEKDLNLVSSGYGFGLVDRGINRMKLDLKIMEEGDFLQPIMRRTRIDIEHLDLDKFIVDLNIHRVVGISKHLCGVATDLTLKLIFNSSLVEQNKFDGILIAMCCRHVCSYEQLLPRSREYLRERGFGESEFAVLKKVVSWAVCGSKDKKEKDEIDGEFEKREKLGFCARRLIDTSRVEAVRELLGEKYSVELFLYAESEVTLENSCLCIKRVR